MPGAGKTQHSQRGSRGPLWWGSGRGGWHPAWLCHPCHPVPVLKGTGADSWGSQGGAACRPLSESEIRLSNVL